MRSVPKTAPKSIRLGDGDFTDRGNQLAFRHAVPIFLDAVMRVCPSIVTDLLEGGLPIAEAARRLGPDRELEATILAYAASWSERWNLRAFWADIVAMNTLADAVDEIKHGRDPEGRLSFPWKSHPAGPGPASGAPTTSWEEDALRNMLSTRVIIPGYEFTYSPLVDSLGDIEARVRSDFDRVWDQVRAARDAEAARLRLAPTSTKLAEHFDVLARFLVGNNGRGESKKSLAESVMGPRTSEANRSHVRNVIRDCATLLHLRLPNGNPPWVNTPRVSKTQGFPDRAA